MNYAKISNNICIGILSNPTEEVALSKGCIPCPSIIKINDIYKDGKWFDGNTNELIDVNIELEQLKINKQEENKSQLSIFLQNNPIQWTDGKYYGVTEEDQTEMALNLMQYQIATQAAQTQMTITPTLEWHARGEACRIFSLEEYTNLSLQVANFVYPYRRYQEQLKVQILNAQSFEELNAIKIDYESFTP